MSAKVVILQEHLPHYRVPFFERLHARLAEEGVCLELICGERHDERFVARPLAWARMVPTHKSGPFLIHRALEHFREADLVISAQELKYLLASWLQLKSRYGSLRFAFWGHGRNFQAADPDSAPERVKRFLATRVDWWFAYNDLSARVVEALGFPPERITSVGNTVDTAGLIKRRSEVTPQELATLRRKLGIVSENVAVFTGGLYASKRLPFLIEAARLMRQKIPDFHLLVIGDGPDRAMVTEAAARDPWIHDLGPMNDHEKVPYWMLSKLLLMPGLVGLVVVDSFALGTPMVTTDYPYHSPEIDYLGNGRNGLVVNCGESAEAYATEIAALLADEARLNSLRSGALADASRYTIEGMAENFASGVLQALRKS